MARRSRGEGTAPYKTSDGRWRAEVIVGWKPDGKPQRKIIYAPSKELCADRLRDAVRARDDGVLTAGRAPTLGEWLTHWLDNIAAPNLKPRTIEGYRSYVRTWITPHRYAKIRLDRLKAEDLEQLYALMREKGRAAATVRQMHAILARALKIAVKRKRLGVSPADQIELPSADEIPFEPDVLTVDEARRLITAAGEVEDGAGWMLALALGLRQGERLGLGWDKIDLAAGTLSIRRTIDSRPYAHGCSDEQPCGKRADHCPQRHGGGQYFGTPKSIASRRELALPQPVIDALRAHKTQQERIAIEEGPHRQPYTDPDGVTVDLVFCQRNGRPWTKRSDWGRWKDFLKSAGVAEVRLHDARHTAATVLLLLDVDPRIVMEIMGWSQISMLTRYQHVLDDMKRTTASAVGDALWQAPTPEPPKDAEVVSLDEWRKRRSG